MVAREGAKPDDPTRDYRKDRPAQDNAQASQPSTVISTAPLHEDISAALNPEPSPSLQPAQEPVDNHTPQVKAASQLPPSVDPVEASQLQRAAAEKVQGQQANGQLGEAFQGEPGGTATLNPDREAAPANKPVTAAVTEPDPIVKQISDELTAKGMNDAADKLNSLPPEQQGQVAKQLQDFLKTQGAKTTKASGRPALEGGITARSNVDLARKKGALDAIKAATQKFIPDTESIIPTSVADKAALVDRLKQMVEHATQANAGVEPTGAYKPRVKPPEWQLLRSAQRVIAKPTPKNIKDYISAENLLRGGDTGAAKDVQDTARIEGDITKKPSEIGSAEVADTQAMPRESFDTLPRQEGKDNTYVDQANTLRDYVHNLSNQDYQTIAQLYDSPAEFHEEVDDAQNPADVQSHFMQAIAATKGQRPGKMQLVGPEESKGTTKRITNAADLAPTEPGAAASAGRSLKGSPEFERLAAQYGGASKAPDRTGRLEQEEKPTINDWQTLDDKVEKMSAGEEPPFFTRGHDLSSAGVPLTAAPMRTQTAINDYVKDLDDQLNLHKNDVLKLAQETKAYLTATPALGKAADEAMYRAIENRTVNQLPQEQQDWVRDHYQPMADKLRSVYDRIADFANNHGFHSDLPTISNGVSKDFIPRRYTSQTWDDKDASSWLDPIGGNPLGNWADTLQRRQEYALQNATSGQRMMVRLTRGEDGDWQLTNAQGKKIGGDLPASFDGNVGDSLNLLRKGSNSGVPDKWILDHATSDEIEKATNGNLVTMRSPAMAVAKALEDASHVLANMKTIADVRESPEFKANTTQDYATAVDRGYDKEQTSLKALAATNGKPNYMPSNLKWALDDFQKRGLGGTSLDPLRTAAQGLLKVFYTLSPVYHPLNEAALYFMGRGEKWLPINGNYSNLGNAWMGAIKSVNTQDALQQEIRDAGGSTMLAGSLVKDRYEDAMKKFSVDVAKQPKAWDFISRQLGVDPMELSRAAYNKSSDITWRLSDYLYTAMYKEHRLNGMDPKSAVDATEKFMSNYRVPSTVGGTGRGGRLISQIINEPALSNFGPYKYGLWKTWADTSKDLLAKSSTTQQRREALGHLVAAGVLGFVIAPYLLDKAAQAVSGNPDARVRRFGPLAIPDAVSQAAQGNKSLGINEAWTPSIPVRSMIELSNNTDYNGKPIVPQEKFTPKGMGDVAANTADWAARAALPPYETLSSASATKGGSTMGALAKLLAQQVGVSLPSEGAQKYQAQIDKKNFQAAKQREKHPAGLMPELYNALTR